ncbi:MAG: lamin tail domain-containing protein [Clostridia bacterium]|nr:lamin tail domain-containing protein [Clostridia bacterium]
MNKGKSAMGRLVKALGAGILIIALAFVWQYVLTGRADTQALSASPVSFSEVMTANASSVADDYGAFSDWFEIVNDSERAVDLTGWMVLRGTEKLDVYTFGRQIIGPDEYVVVFASGRSQNNPAYVCHAPFGLAAAGDTLTLLNAAGQVMDTIETPSLARNQVYAFMDGAWRVTSDYTPGLPNTAESYEALMATEGLADSGSVVVSEVMIKNRAAIQDDTGAYSDYIELQNTGSRAVNLKGYMLSDSDTALDKFVFPDASIPAGGCLLVFASGAEQRAGELHAGFKLSKDETVYFSNPQGHILASVTPVTDGSDQAWSLTKNGWTSLYPPTPGQPNNESGLAVMDQDVTAANRSSLYISEIMASTNDTSLSSGAYDWIEIYNAAGGTLDLSGFGLSDSSSRPRKWQFPTGSSIGPGEYMIVFCSGRDTKTGGSYHTNFALGAEGGYSVTLCDPSGQIVDRVAVDRQYTNISYGRAYGVSGLRYFLEPTPGAANNTYGYVGRAQEAVYSVEGGLFDEGETVTVTLSAPQGSSIYYTTDCSDPDNTSTLYSGPITLNSTTILRTRVYSTSEIPSLVATQSYFFGVSHTMRIVSLVTDPVNLWDYNTGIYVKGPNAWAEAPYGANNQGANFWMDWEKAANVEVFTSSGDVMLSQGCGLKLQGQYSRQQEQKAFKVIARSAYSGDNRFRAALFSDRPYTEYQSFILRASGQDSGRTRVRDVLQTSLADATDVMYQAAEMCVVYLNGEYWGHYNMRERINKYSIAQWEGWTSDPDDIDIVKANSNVMQGSNETFANLLNWIKKEGGATARSKKETLTQADYDEILEHISSVVDVDNYLDYVIIQVFTGNTDLLNVKRYRSANEDGLWRWVLFDMDWGFHYADTNSMRRWLDPEGAGSGKKTDNTLFVELMKNPAIQDKFLRRYNELFVSTFNPESVFGRMVALYSELEPEIDQHLARWNGSRSVYDREWTSMRKVIYERYDLMTGYIQETFGFTDEQMQDYFGDMLRLIADYKAEHS